MANRYLVLTGMHMRAQTAYRGSFAVELVASVGATVTGFAELYVIFANVPVLGGLTFPAALLVFALGHVSFSIADVLVGHLDTLPTYLRAGTLGRTVAVSVLAAAALARNDVRWSPADAALVLVTVCSGAAIFAALFVAAAAAQFWLVEGTEFTAAFVYGGSYAAQFPASAFSLPVRLLFTFVVPAAFVAYLPVLTLLGRPAPDGAPQWIGWCTPVAAAVLWAVALLGWRAGLRHYTGAGS